jgi:LPXTG-site transpeptidase (sortase) family protein
MGFIVLIIFLFGFFNQLIIAPFIQPGSNNSNTPLIVSASNVSPTDQPEVIIPKINVEAPVNYKLKTNNEKVIENKLEGGPIHYASTVEPGQNGNVAIFGHSSNNILNPGHYKFVFVLLHKLKPGDTFYLTYKGKIYVYKVFHRVIVNPSQVGILPKTYGKKDTATLITCDPPGTSLHRLAVTGVQISPSVSTNSTPKHTPTTSAPPANLASNGPSLWDRIISWF